MTARTFIALVVALGPCALQAQDSEDVHPFLNSNWWVDVGSFYPDRKLTLSAQGRVSGIVNEHEFDEKLGLSERDPLFEGQIGWQFGEKWGVAVQHFESSNTSSRTLQQDVEWEDVVYEVGATVKAGSELAVTRFVFSRRFYDRGPHDFRIGAGIHWLDIGAFIAGQANIDDNTTEFRQSQNSVSGPLPNIGGWYRYSPSKKWLFSLRADWLEASVDDINGTITNIAGSVNYSIFDNFGIGLGYQRFGLNVKLSDTNWRGTVDLTYSGPALYISGYW
jgi:hypothetical protein